MLDLHGKTAIVTGASRGIGAAIAKKLASCGASVAIIYKGSEEKAQSVKAEITESYGTACEIFKCDVASSSECVATVKAVTEALGAPDILVNNAGITKDSLLVTMEEEAFDAVIDTNLKGAFNMIKACGRSFIKKKYGKIINISSVSGLMGLAGQANYSASKAGLIGLTKAVAKEFAGKNICCNAIAPGFIKTDMTKDMSEEDFISAIPLKRLGEAEDVADLCLFLASSMSDYITGEVIRADGGLCM